MSEPLDLPPNDAPARARFLQVFLAQRGRMENLVSRRVGCRATAADLVQELFLRFWRRPQVEVEALDSYLMRCAGNIAIDHLRSEGARERINDNLPEPLELPLESQPEAAHAATSDLRRIDRALRELPERTRHIFLLNRLHGRTYGEIAQAVGLSQSAVEKHMMRALDACKASIADEPALPRKSRRLGGIATAASMVLLLAVIAGWHPADWLRDLGADYVAPVGQLREVTLADNSQLVLDADTAISVDFSHGQRRIEVRRGAVFFHVTHTGQPFVVETEGGRTEVLGTQFEVRQQARGAQVTVLSGRVGVTAAEGEVQQVLTANQQVEYHDGHAGSVHGVDSEGRLAWRQGWLNYYQVPLSQVVDDLARYYPGRIILLDRELGARKVSGSFPGNDPLAALDALGAVAGFERHTLLGRVTLLR